MSLQKSHTCKIVNIIYYLFYFANCVRVVMTAMPLPFNLIAKLNFMVRLVGVGNIEKLGVSILLGEYQKILALKEIMGLARPEAGKFHLLN